MLFRVKVFNTAREYEIAAGSGHLRNGLRVIECRI